MIEIALRCTFFVVIILLKWISAKKLLKMGTKQIALSEFLLTYFFTLRIIIVTDRQRRVSIERLSKKLFQDAVFCPAL